MNKHISIKDAILYSVNAVFSHPWYFIKVFLLWFGLSIGLHLLAVALGLSLFVFAGVNQFPPVAISFFYAPALILTLFFFYWVAMVLWLVPAKLLLRFYDTASNTISLRAVFSLFHLPLLFRLVVSIFLYGLLISIGTLFLVVPGIYAWVKFQFVFYNLINRNCGIIKAFQLSYEQTNGNFWRLLVLNLIAITLNSIVIAMPIAYLLIIYAYRQLPNSNNVSL